MANDEKAVWTKIGFKQSAQGLVKNGPSASVGIGAAGAACASFKALAQIDTGAAGCGIGPDVAKRLNLEPVGFGAIHEAGREPITANFFAIRLFLPGMDIDLDVAGLPSLAAPHEILIGRDALARFRLLVDFTTGITQFHIKSDP